MIKIHFEIGHIKEHHPDRYETERVFTADTLSECLKEFKDRKYTTDDYFIDVWETDSEGIPMPVADIKIEDWIFKE